MKLGFSLQIFEKLSNFESNENPSSETLVAACGHDDADSRFS